MTPEAAEKERQARVEKVEAWYAAESAVFRAKQMLLGAGLILKNAEYPPHLEVYDGLKMTITTFNAILAHFAKGAPFEERPQPKGQKAQNV